MRISFLDRVAKEGNTFTVEDILNYTEIQRNVLWVILSRLAKKGWIERVEKGKYMIVPLGAEKGKYTLNEFVIASILVEPSCIAYWSALNFYGLTEQIPGTVFIQTTSRKKKQHIDIFGVHYRIIKLKEKKIFGIRKEWIDEEPINITDKEKTIIDCLDKPQYCGWVVEVEKALKTNDLGKEKLKEYAERIGNSGVIRRLGFLCDFLGIDIKISGLETRNYLFLDPTMQHKGPYNAKWRLVVNLNEKILGDLE